MSIRYEKNKKCRWCYKTKLDTVLDLGELVPSDFVSMVTDKETKVPLTLVRCENCGLVQLAHTVDREDLYRQYWYRSKLNPSMREALQDIVNYVDKEHVLSKSFPEIIVDIGCNDGTMLSLFSKKEYPNLTTVGFDPARNLADEAESNCDVFINDFFSCRDYKLTGLNKASLVTAIAMFYDLPDLDEFMFSVTEILKDGGYFLIQLTDLTTTLKINAIDNICHEHLEYYTVRFLKRMGEYYGLKLVDVTYNEVNGGSARLLFTNEVDYPYISSSINRSLVDEFNYYKNDSLDGLQERTDKIKRKVVNFIKTRVKQGNTVAVMGASTKGNTLLQYFGLDHSLIDHAAEINEDKFGLLTAGTFIPIVSETQSLISNPNYYLVLPWHFIDNFLERYEEYLKDGGIFIVPLPTPRVYYFTKTENLTYDDSVCIAKSLKEGEIRYYELE